MIHLGNYEEFFILYMDGELSAEQMQMVDDFLSLHPDLQGEFQMLLSTKLPEETFTIDKSELIASFMNASSIDENLLLYIDNEISSDKRKIVEAKLASNKNYQLQHQVLLQTKLDANETIPHPNKKELYRREERKVIAFAPWMRIAAAAVAIAAMGVFYFTNSSSTNSETTHSIANGTKKNSSIKQNPSVKQNIDQQKENLASVKNIDGISTEKKSASINKEQKIKLEFSKEIEENIAVVKQENEEVIAIVEPPLKIQKSSIVEGSLLNNATASANNSSSQIININSVTSVVSNRKIDEPVATIANEKVDIAKGGSVKGFLRKATRLIEKRTGFDPTNDGELLIGVVAINVK